MDKILVIGRHAIIFGGEAEGREFFERGETRGFDVRYVAREYQADPVARRLVLLHLEDLIWES